MNFRFYRISLYWVRWWACHEGALMSDEDENIMNVGCYNSQAGRCSLHPALPQLWIFPSTSHCDTLIDFSWLIILITRFFITFWINVLLHIQDTSGPASRPKQKKYKSRYWGKYFKTVNTHCDIDIPGKPKTATLISFFLIKCWYCCYRVLWCLIVEYEGNFTKLSHSADVGITQSNYPLV